MQGLDTRVIAKSTPGFWTKNCRKKQQKTAPILIQFHFVIMFTASNDQYVVNFQIFSYSKVLVNLSTGLADELNQPMSFPTASSNKKIQKPNKVQNPIKPPKPSGFLKTQVFLNPDR